MEICTQAFGDKFKNLLVHFRKFFWYTETELMHHRADETGNEAKTDIFFYLKASIIVGVVTQR